jgi:hypothetical protein
VEPRGPRERIEDFMRRWRSQVPYEGNRVLRVLAVAILLALLVLRRLRVIAVPVLIGAILVAGWLLIGPLVTIPRFTTEGPVVRNGVAVIVACGRKRGLEQMGAAMKYAPEPATGGWWNVRRGDCTIWYHNPPGLEQRYNRHERAQRERETSVVRGNDSVWACGREVSEAVGDPALARDLARGMRKDCGIYAD